MLCAPYPENVVAVSRETLRLSLLVEFLGAHRHPPPHSTSLRFLICDNNKSILSILSRNRLFRVDFLHPLKILFGFLDWYHIDAQPVLTEYKTNRVTEHWVGHLCRTKLGEKYKWVSGDRPVLVIPLWETSLRTFHSRVLQKRRDKTPSSLLPSKQRGLCTEPMLGCVYPSWHSQSLCVWLCTVAHWASNPGANQGFQNRGECRRRNHS